MGFKEDARFARYVTMGVVGAAAVAHDLRDRFGHRPVELERYSMANKIWREKVKRLRIPDLVCLQCGRRVESRAKTVLEVKLSDSETVGRQWHAGGMRDDDLFAFVRVDLTPEMPAVGRPAYFARADLHGVADLARRGVRKAASQGSEVDLSWPAWVPSTDGTLVGVRDGKVVFQPPTGGQRSYWQSTRWLAVHLYLSPGERFQAQETIVAGVVPPPHVLRCPGDTWDVAADLRSDDDTTRYAAVKAAGILHDDRFIPALVAITADDREDWRVRLEALGSLARAQPERWLPKLGAVARDLHRPLQEQTEAVFVLSENPAAKAADLLADVAAASPGHDEEVRSAAVWGLGTGAHREPDRLIPFVLDAADRVAVHAVAALPSLSEAAVQELSRAARAGDTRVSAVATAALAHHRRLDVLVQLASESSPGRLWALCALGDYPPTEVEAAAGGRLSAALREFLEPIWIRHVDWLHSEENEGAIQALADQRMRFDPADP